MSERTNEKEEVESNTEIELNKYGTRITVKKFGNYDNQMTIPQIENRFNVQIDSIEELKEFLQSEVKEGIKTYSFELVCLNNDSDFKFDDLDVEDDENSKGKTINDYLDDYYNHNDYLYDDYYLVKTKKNFYNHFRLSGITGIESISPPEKVNNHYVLIHKDDIDSFITQSDYNFSLYPNKTELAERIMENGGE